MNDYIVKATAANATVMAMSVLSTNTVREAKKLHGLSPVASAALGRTLTAASMMSQMLKSGKGKLTIQIKGDGPLGGIVVAADSNANVRGYVHNPGVYLPLNESGKLDVSSGVGKKGYLNVIKDIGLKEPYIGYVDLVSGEIGDDIAYYFAYSEQTPSVVALGVLVDVDGNILNAGGYIIQLMPGADEDTVDYLENKIKTIPSVTSMLSDGKMPEDILELILGEKGLEIHEKIPCAYKCNCSRERMESNILSMGAKDILEIIEEQHGAELVCHFCNSKYYFTEEDLKRLLENAATSKLGEHTGE